MVETLLVEYVLKRLSGPRLLIKHLMEEPDFSQLIGLNDPIDQQWQQRKLAGNRTKSTLNERRSKLKELKQTVFQKSNPQLSSSPPPKAPAPASFCIANKELAFEFVTALEKFKESSTRDSGVALCQNHIKKHQNNDNSLYTLLECLLASSKKSFNPQTNAQNHLATDLELLTLAEIVKANAEIIAPHLEKVLKITKQHLHSQIESTVQAIALVYMCCMEHLGAILELLMSKVLDKAQQEQCVHIITLLSYYAKASNLSDHVQLICSKQTEIFQKLMVESQEFLEGIQFLIQEGLLQLEPAIVIQRLLKYLRIPINKSSTFYQITIQVCRILQLLGSKQQGSLQKEVTSELERYVNDRRVSVQQAARQALEAWRTGCSSKPPNLDYQSKIQYSRVPYSEYRNKGFQSNLRASQFVRKTSRSPSLTNKSQQPAKIREKLFKSPSVREKKGDKFQMLEEETENQRRSKALQLLKSKSQQKFLANGSQLEDSLEFEHGLQLQVFQQDKLDSIKESARELASEANRAKDQDRNHPNESLGPNCVENADGVESKLFEKETIEDSLVRPDRKEFPNQAIQSVAKCQASPHGQSEEGQIKVLAQDCTNRSEQEAIERNDEKANQERALNDSLHKGSLPKLPSIQHIDNLQELKQSIHSQKSTERKEVCLKPVALANSNYQQIGRIQKVQGQNNQIETSEQVEVEENEENPSAGLPILPPSEPLRTRDCFENGSTYEFQEVVSKRNGIDESGEAVADVSTPVVSANVFNTEYSKVGGLKFQVNAGQKEGSGDALLEANISEEEQSAQKNEEKRKVESVTHISAVEPKQQSQGRDQKAQERPSNLELDAQEPAIGSKEKVYEGQKTALSAQNTQPEGMGEKRAPTIDTQQYDYFAQALKCADVNEGYSLVLDNCDELYILKFMMRKGPVLEQLSHKTLNKLIGFMQKIQKAELLNLLGLQLFQQVQQSEFFEELPQNLLHQSKEVLYQICASEQEYIGWNAVNIYNGIQK